MKRQYWTDYSLITAALGHAAFSEGEVSCKTEVMEKQDRKS